MGKRFCFLIISFIIRLCTNNYQMQYREICIEMGNYIERFCFQIYVREEVSFSFEKELLSFVVLCK